MSCNVEDGYYFKEPITCSTCVYPCKTCSDSDSCLSCPDGRYFYGNYCYFYEDYVYTCFILTLSSYSV